jgi:transcriptional regulator with XRE-family HTH domain
VTHDDERTPDERLSDAVEASGLSHREIARRIAGDEAADTAVERERRNLLRWLSGEHMPSPAKATLLASILGGDVTDYRQSPDQVRRTLQQRLRRAEAEIAEIRRMLP